MKALQSSSLTFHFKTHNSNPKCLLLFLSLSFNAILSLSLFFVIGKISKNDKNNNINRQEILDLGDLDLSQLRLTKKDLETLSNIITPNLSKNVQEQLLAQLPPNQAKKLSRTLSMQNQNNKPVANHQESPSVYRRSVSSNQRDVSSTNRYSRDSVTPTNEVFDSINNNNTKLNNTSSLSYNKHEHKYRERTLSPPPKTLSSEYSNQYYTNTRGNNNNISTSNEDIERACFSPPPLSKEETTTRKSTKKYSSRESASEKSHKELATQKILRELREASQERSVNHETDMKGNKISYYLDKYSTSEMNKVLDNGDPIYANIEQQHQPTSTINDKILDELNSISLLNSQLEKFDQTEAKEVRSSKKKKSVEKASSRSKEIVVETDVNISSESKIARPKSFISSSKEAPLKSSDRNIKETSPSKLERPKSFPNSKFSKELKKLSTDPPPPSSEETFVEPKVMPSEKKEAVETEPKKVKKIIKVVKKSSKKSAAANAEQQNLIEPPPETSATAAASSTPTTDVKKEKSPDRKGGSSKGLFYTLGQKFEKLRDTKTKKNSEEVNPPQQQQQQTSITTPTNETPSLSATMDMKEKKKKLKAMLSEDVDELTRQERKSKIDAMIKNLKEKSIPHNTEMTESGLIKRAVSVEEMPNTFNKNTVNKVLGLFKRIERENENKTNRVQNTKSTSYISSIEMSSCDTSNINSAAAVTKERPKSGGFIKRNGSSFEPLANICESKIPVKYTCPDCKPPPPPPTTEMPSTSSSSSNVVVKRYSDERVVEEKERLKNNRKGLMLDLARFKSPEPEGNGNNSKGNYSFPPPLPHDIISPQTPTRALYENLANYSSNTFDASASSLSPCEDIGYDGWSTCSDDHVSSLHHPMGTLSLTRLRSTQSQGHDDPDESVVDRIRRKSFYSRFNEKKAKRVSTIVGAAAVKDYYRERSKPLEYTKSATSTIPDMSSSRASSVEPHIRSTSRYSSSSTAAATAANRSLSQTRPSKYATTTSSDKYEKASTNDFSSAALTNTTSSSSTSYHRMSRNENSHLSSLPPYHVHHTAHHHHHMDEPTSSSSSKLKSNRNTMYDSSSSSSTNTPSLSSLYKRRSFVSTSGNSSSTNTSHYSSASSASTLKQPQSFVDSYATIGRKMRAYNTRSVSLLDPTLISSSAASTNYINSFLDSSNSSSSHHRSNINGYAGDSGAPSSSSSTSR